MEGLVGVDPKPRPGFNVLLDESVPGMMGEGDVPDDDDFRAGLRKEGSYKGMRTTRCMKCDDSRNDRTARAYDGTCARSTGGGRMTVARLR